MTIPAPLTPSPKNNGNWVIDNTFGFMTGPATVASVTVKNGGIVNVTYPLIVTGNFNIDNGSSATISADLNIGGTFTDNGGTVLISAPIAIDPVITSSLVIEHGGNITISAPTTVEGAVQVETGSSLSIGANLTAQSLSISGSYNSVESNVTLNNSTLTLVLGSSPQDVSIGNGTTFTANGGTINAGIDGSGSFVTTGTVTVADAISGSVGVQIQSGTLTLDANSTLHSATFQNSGTLDLGAGVDVTFTGGAVDPGNVQLNGGTLTDASGFNLLSESVTGDGTVSGAFNGGNATVNNGTLQFTGNVDSTSGTEFQIGSGATLELKGHVGSGAVVDFLNNSSTPGTLDIAPEGIGKFDGTIWNFNNGDQIDVAGNSNDTVSYDPTSGRLMVSDGTKTVLNTVLEGDRPAGQSADVTGQWNGNLQEYVLTAVGGSGSETPPPICFLAGTLIRTPGGDVAVETLKSGDLVVTHDGREVPVCWLGKQTISMRFADPLRVLPIRVKAGALDENVPMRDLLLSPDHALLIGGALVQAGALVNGSSILRETRVPMTFVYYHVEADDHALILAEGAPAETFVDNVDRLNFDNWSEYEALYPDGKTVEELPYPRAKSHRQVPVAIRVRLADRARTIAEDVSTVA